jgi:hypothetical protein
VTQQEIRLLFPFSHMHEKGGGEEDSIRNAFMSVVLLVVYSLRRSLWPIGGDPAAGRGWLFLMEG